MYVQSFRYTFINKLFMSIYCMFFFFFFFEFCRRRLFENIIFTFYVIYVSSKIYFRDRQYFSISNQLPYNLHNFTCYIEWNTHIYIFWLLYDEKQFNKILSKTQNDFVEFSI